jgi:hypothetical protein
MPRSEAEKTAALQKALAQLERQAEQTRESLQAALDLPESKNMATAIDQVTKALEKQLDTRGRLKAEVSDAKAEEQRLKLLRDAAVGTAAAADAETAYQAQLERSTKAIDALNRGNVKLAETLSLNSDVAAKFSDVIDDLNNGVEVSAERMAKMTQAQEKFNKAVGAGAELSEGLWDSLVGLDEGPLTKLVGSLQGGSDGLKSMASDFFDTSKLTKRLGSGLLKLAQESFKFAMEQDKIFAEFRKSTGAGVEFNKMIKEGEEAGRSYGVTLGESAAAIGALKNTFTEFTYLAPDVQNDIRDTSLVLGEMGLDAQTSADFFQMSMTGMGMGAKEANQALLDLSATAQGLGVDVNKMGQDFIANREILSRYGGNAVDVFKDMAVQAKATGIEVGTLMGFVDQFKTFDQAGQSVGRLNAIMGGPFLNSIDMLNAAMEDPVEGIRMMKSAIDQAGISAEELSGAEVMAFADALGMSAEDTRKMLSESNEELDQRTMSMKEAADQTTKMQNITDELKNAFRELIIDAEPFVTNVLKPTISALAKAVSWLGKASGSLGEFGSTAIFAGTAMAGLMMMIPGMQPFAIAGLAILGGLGVAALTDSASGEQEGNLSKPSSLKGYAAGGRHIAGAARSPRSSSVAVVGEGGPELAELGSAANISSASTTERLTRAMENMSSDLRKLPTGGESGDTHLAVSIAGEKIEELVIKSLRSPRARNVLGPYAGA